MNRKDQFAWLTSLALLLLLAGCSGLPFAPVLPTATITQPSFSEITFSQNVTDSGEIIHPMISFPAGTVKVWAYFTYSGMQEGQTWGRLWNAEM